MNRSAALAVLLLAAPAHAQVVRDGTLGTGSRTLSGPNYSITQSHGELRSGGVLERDQRRCRRSEMAHHTQSDTADRGIFVIEMG